MKPQIMDETAMKRALMRISHEIVEKNEECENLCVVGIKRRGVALAEQIVSNLSSLGVEVLSATIDITRYRDDLSPVSDAVSVKDSGISFDVNGKTVILVDDVIYTGRTARAAMEAVIQMGRPSCIQLAVLVDRGHRELPIRPDFVGKNVPTSRSEIIRVNIPPYDETTGVIIDRQEQ